MKKGYWNQKQVLRNLQKYAFYKMKNLIKNFVDLGKIMTRG